MLPIYLDNIIFRLQNAGGISNYWSKLIKYIQKTNMNVQYLHAQNNNIYCQDIKIQDDKIVNCKKWMAYRYSPILGLNKRSIFHSSYYRYAPGLKNVTTVHDLISEKYCYGYKHLIQSLQKRLAINNSSSIICVSNNTKNDLIDYYDEMHSKKIYVIYEGVSDEFKPIKTEKEDIVLFIGHRDNYKRFDIVIELAAINEMRLYFVGGHTISDREKKMLTNRLGDRYRHYYNISDAELNILYNKATALIYPSEYEGFGLPVLEAMKAGCPVIAYNCSSIGEITNGAAMLVKENSIEEYQKYFKQLDDNQIRQKYIKKGQENALKYTWDRTFKETLRVYNDLKEGE